MNHCEDCNLVNQKMKNLLALQKKFNALFAAAPRIFRAPGRVNLIGEHTDYNDGFVLPAALDFATYVAIAPRADRRLIIYSENISEQVECELDDFQPRQHWSDYPRGVAALLQQSGVALRGANLLIQGNVPIGSGLSSSAAIEVATALALVEINGLAIDRTALAKICQQAENEFVGLQCGIMDQFIACHGRSGHALLLDCRSLEYRLLPLSDAARLVICNTMVKHELANSEYNKRRAECEAGVKYLAQFLPHITALRDVAGNDLVRFGINLPELIYRRCQHIVSENQRVLGAAAALERNDLAAFGKLMNESHRSLRDDYEVSCRELDWLVASAQKIAGVYGARMTGGGFGGCTINLVRTENVEDFQRQISRDYQSETGCPPEIYVCAAADGAREIKFDR